MLYAVLVLASFAAGVVVTMLFGRRMAELVIDEAKAVAFDAGRVVSDAQTKIRSTVSVMELRLHSKLDAVHGKLDSLIGGAAPAPPPDQGEGDKQPPTHG